MVLGSAAFLVQSKGDLLDRPARIEEGVAAVAFVIGLLVLVFSEATVAEVLLAVFIGAIFRRVGAGDAGPSDGREQSPEGPDR